MNGKDVKKPIDTVMDEIFCTAMTVQKMAKMEKWRNGAPLEK